jgi:AraC family transcriptional regulator, regulatory protein of adaptative response / methylated-DNA-[protein]-cysteine methyltransferase
MSTVSETRAAVTVSDPRWASVLTRDRAADGQFVYAVRTTGVYCRPSCASRTARPENVEFHATAADAERAGFRACKRCRPDQAMADNGHVALVTSLCRYIEQADQPPTLEMLARRAGLSAFHLHRIFKAATGVTPKQYADAHRTRRVREQLRGSSTVTDAIYDAGFNSSGRFYGQSAAILGMTPTQHRAGGARAVIHFAVGECSLGSILVAASDRGVCAILLGDDPDLLLRDLQDRFSRAELVGGDSDFEHLVARVVALVEAPSRGLDLPLDVRGTAFQQRVWRALRAVPAGRTASYAEIARTIGAPTAVRAVAHAVASNPLAVAIPCHRIVRSDGALAGYRWGVERKRALLDRESAGT